MNLETLEYAVDGHVATITLNRPDKLNAFNRTMALEFAAIWARIRGDDDVRVVVLRANGVRAFCSGIDVSEPRDPDDPWTADPTAPLSPKRAEVWKPLVCAVHGIAAGGAFVWINDADIVICGQDATFFDPHLDIGLVTSHTAMGMARVGVPFREAMRISLLGLDERLSAERAHQIGLASEVVPSAQLWDRADELARLIAAKPPAVVQASVQAIWTTRSLPWEQARAIGLQFSHDVNPVGRQQRADEPRISRRWTLR